MKVEQFLNRNQFRLYDTNINILQSYNSKVVEIKGHEYQFIILGKDWDYSTTTSKHVYAFLDKYSKVNFCEVINKRKYIKDLIEECKRDRFEFIKNNHYEIVYDEEMV